ncbi:MAG TPA: polyphosphate kinase 1 [Pyrinomonadaceae bacterium]|nr:polyphosphate kinase 1 [Pyrinomonadaceae bacterium]
MSTALKNDSRSRTLQAVTARLPALHPTAGGASRLFFNRELSLLEFHRRVLEEGFDASNPILERLKFLGIFSSNLDEFFMIRVSGLKEELEENVTELSPDGMTPEEQLREIRRRVLPMVEEQTRYLRDDLLPALAAENIHLVSYDSLSKSEQATLGDYFQQKVFPVLTPLAVDPSHPFPYISPLSLNLGLMVQAPEGKSFADPKQRHVPRFVRIKVPPVVPRLVPVGKLSGRFVLLEDLIEANVESLFPGMITDKCHRFRVTRDADIEIREDKAEDLLRVIQQELRKRRFGTPVRLEVSAGMPQEMINYLTESLGLTDEDVYLIDGPLSLQDLSALADLNRPDLKYPSFTPAVPEWLGKRSLFDVIKEQDILLHHPFDAYKTVTDFINEAVDDENVVAIKICLYRTGPESPIPPALIRAAENGKQVTALIELKARFDEEHNIEWANKLDEAGVHVVYGVLGLKTHGKVTLVVRREGTSLRRYVHVASGNYNPTTSCFYTDVGLFTCDETVGADATEMFNYLTGWSRQTEYRKLLVAPVNLKLNTIDLIDREIKHREEGRPAHIIAKLNRLADKDIIEKLYDASKAGVKIDLIVRGVCMLRPGVPGLSENITVRNVIGRFLEHSRVFSFANGGDDEVYIGSADWMKRNLKYRIEVVTPVSDPSLRRYLKDVLLAAYLKDNVKARQLEPDGSYTRIERQPGEKPFDSQQFFINHETAFS